MTDARSLSLPLSLPLSLSLSLSVSLCLFLSVCLSIEKNEINSLDASSYEISDPQRDIAIRHCR